MKLKPEAILQSYGKMYVPRRHRAGTFKKGTGVVIRLDFHPIICDELHRQWCEVRLEMYKSSEKYLELMKGKDDEKKLEAAKELEKSATVGMDIAMKLIKALIESNDNPEEYATDEWLNVNLTAEDLQDLITKAFDVEYETKKK